MLKTILLALLAINIFALEISFQGAKENHQPYSTLHIKDDNKFLCQEIKNDFDVTVKIVCAFSHSPSQKISKLQNSFFEVDTEIKNKTFFLVIKPYQKMKLFPMVFDLTKEDTVFDSNVELSNHWMIIGYIEDIPYIEKSVDSGVAINFPYTSKMEKLPYVGSLDISGNPVHVKRVGDVTEYIKIKKYYEEKNYEFCLELINDVMKEYPDSLFRAELLFYKIRVYSKMQENEKVIEVSKDYLKDYSSDENVPEVLSLIAKAYNKAGFNSDADYFFDRLFSEHPDSVYAKWGYIYMAEALESSGNLSKAKSLYEKAIQETDNVDVAIEAGFRLAQIYMSNANVKAAAEYIEKVVKAKPAYFSEENLEKSMDLMYEFIDASDYLSGVAIAKAIFEKMDPNDDRYERFTKDIGIWLSKTNEKKDALTALNKYLELFNDGTYSQEVQVAKDALFFDVNDENATSKLVSYDKLIGEYKEDSIGKKATYEKAKLLIEQGKFTEALDMEAKLLSLDKEEYKDIPKLISDAAIGKMKQALEAKECNSVLVISSQYKIELSSEWDDGVYTCAMKGADFVLAKKMADRNLKSKDINERKKWLNRYIKVDFATGNYSNVIEASKELISLIENDKDSEYKDVYRYLFDTYRRLEDTNKMIESIAVIQKVYEENYADIDRYVAVMAVGSDKKDNNLVIEYGQKVMDIQIASNSHAQSPFVEFALYQAYSDKENYNRAFEVIKSLDKLELNKNDGARQKYLLGTVLDKLWRNDDAKKAYQEAIDIDKDSAWAGLAKSAKGL
ncbi:MAG: flagellar protein [Sulfurimonas sp. RIFOXYD12_FULL_33_39]|uniref:tetratricopeptide repeat protein n=1 Tax=unclassified Sulfurimonas TaxID=2623549 RepID=UPI0008BD0786|nr:MULTISPECIES: tetratricopeptide repeat protein [unclassified Sulfurimonas]OHE09705.1 MAG: flagellar protein [Sulfurimonas sp. RIFOXYD12_FULL_33_39]OHE13787.1 MAG: flagellar protein [Sulfurimonas sp. RIFOXYD2_FULL_34_21]